MTLDAVVDQNQQNQSERIPDIDLDDEKINVAAYIRVSTEKQVEEGSHLRQKNTVREWCSEHLEDRYEITFFEDIAESGQNLSRDEYEQMMDMAHRFDMVVVRELSRFGRNLQKMLQDIEILEDNDCDFISIKDEQMDTTSAQGQLLFHIIGAFNQFWADIARERTKEMIQRRREEGKLVGRPRKLSDEHIKHLMEIKEEQGYSYATLAAIAEQKWDTSVTRQTMARYMKLDKEEVE